MHVIFAMEECNDGKKLMHDGLDVCGTEEWFAAAVAFDELMQVILDEIQSKVKSTIRFIGDDVAETDHMFVA